MEHTGKLRYFLHISAIWVTWKSRCVAGTVRDVALGSSGQSLFTSADVARAAPIAFWSFAELSDQFIDTGQRLDKLPLTARL
ncbi:hypothetical protein [Streptomyces chryseus]